MSIVSVDSSLRKQVLWVNMIRIKWPQGCRVICLIAGIFTLAGLPAYSQAVLEDFTSLRNTLGSQVPLWQVFPGGLGGQCYNQTFSVANNTGNVAITGCGQNCGSPNVGDANHSCMYLAPGIAQPISGRTRRAICNPTSRQALGTRRIIV